jgi:Lipid desaturase domain
MYVKPVRPLYLMCDRVQVTTAWIGIALNVLLICWCAYWVATADETLIPNAIDMATIILIGLFMADFLSGFVHWVTDTWFDEVLSDRVVSIAREHHLYPSHILGYGFRDYVAYSSWPTILALGPIELLLTLAFAPAVWLYPLVFLCLTVNVHHGGNHDIRYCVINGWANFVFDHIGFWRGLERLVTILTGAHPRRNDQAWRTRFHNDPDFLPTERKRVKDQYTMSQARLARSNGCKPRPEEATGQTWTGEYVEPLPERGEDTAYPA